MGKRSIPMIEQTEMIYRWHRGESQRAISRSLGVSRKTIRRYVNRVKDAGLSQDKPLPPDAEIAVLLNQEKKNQHKPCQTPVQDRLRAHDDELSEWSKDSAISQSQMWRLFQEQHPELQVSLTTFKEYIRQNHRPIEVKSTLRLVTPPGQAQVDFGYVGLMFDSVSGKQRKSWAFVMTLSHSRHRFVRFVTQQDVATWNDCHSRAFEFFGGVPQSILLDNLKAGVVKPDLYDPTLNRHYQECERHYGFAADPAKVRSPQHKGRVERCVPVVRGHLLAGRQFVSINEANERALIWCREEIGTQIHGTTKERPIEIFERVDKGNLLPLPAERFEVAHWQQGKVSRDHHVVFNGAYYSVPTRWIGYSVDIRGTERLVQIFYQGELIKTHQPTKRGTFQSDPKDYPERQRIYLLQTAEVCREKAQEMGKATKEVMGLLLNRETNRNLRKAHKLLRLGTQYGAERLEVVCQQALDYQTLEISFFEGALKQPPLVAEENRQPAPGYLREPSYFAHAQEEKQCNTN
jgi:transposase